MYSARGPSSIFWKANKEPMGKARALTSVQNAIREPSRASGGVENASQGSEGQFGSEPSQNAFLTDKS